MKQTLVIVLIVMVIILAIACNDTPLQPQNDTAQQDKQSKTEAKAEEELEKEGPKIKETAASKPEDSEPKPTIKKDWVTVVVAFADYHEGEFRSVADALEGGGYRMVVVSTQKGDATSSSGSTVEVEKTIEEVDDVGLGIIVSGGNGIIKEWENEALIALVQQANQNGALVAAICAGPGVLGNAGVLQGKQASWYDGPNTNQVMSGAGCTRSGKPVTVDGNTITGENPSAAQAFGQAIVEYLDSL